MTDIQPIISSPRISLVKPSLAFLDEFVEKANVSKVDHEPWVQAPCTRDEYESYLNRQNKDNNISFLIIANQTNELIGVININEIVRGLFSSGYLGYYRFSGYEREGWMNESLDLVLNYAFNPLQLHRLEANIQPGNIKSLLLAQNCGFLKEGYSKHYLNIDGSWKDHIRYAMTKERFNHVSRSPIPQLRIRQLVKSDIDDLSASFIQAGWNKPVEVFKRYYEQYTQGQRIIWVAIVDGQFAGYVTLVWQSLYQPFADNQIPEIKDLNVLPSFRNNGIGTALIVAAERCAFQQATQIGLGSGVYRDYGSAQKLYHSLGYVPDGNGITSYYKPVTPGTSLILDDELCIWFVKSL